MVTPGPDSLDRLSHAELIGLVRELIGEVKRVQAENEKLNAAFSKLKVEQQAVKDELARSKGLPPRPPHKPPGMDKSTGRSGAGYESIVVQDLALHPTVIGASVGKHRMARQSSLISNLGSLAAMVLICIAWC
jgi:hypothetical protein